MKKSENLWLTLVATRDCNLRCLYCYVDKGMTNETMSVPLAKKSILAFIKEFPTVKSLTIAFFGGESTLCPQFIKKIVSFSKALGIPVSFRISTNGICSSKLWEFLIKNNFYVVLSMDGVPKMNEITRGKSEGLEKKIKKIVEKKGKFHIRATLTRKNIESFPDAIKWWANLGVKLIHFEIVTPAGKQRQDKILTPDNKILRENIENAVKTANREGIFLMYSSWMNLSFKSDYFCGLCREHSYIILPDGHISSCFRIQSIDDFGAEFFITGQIKNSNINWNKNRELLKKISIERMSLCRNCSVRKICSGGCPQRHLANSDSIFVPSKNYCQMKKTLIGLAQELLAEGYKSVLGFNYYIKKEVTKMKSDKNKRKEENQQKNKILEKKTVEEIPKTEACF